MHITPPLNSELQLPMPIHKGLQCLWPCCLLLGDCPHHDRKSIAPRCCQCSRSGSILFYGLGNRPVRHVLTCMPLMQLLLMRCPEMNLVGLHTDLQMLFHPYRLLLYILCHIFNKLGGGLHIPHMCGISGVTRWQRHGCQLGVTWHARGMPVDSWCCTLCGGGLCFPNVVGRLWVAGCQRHGWQRGVTWHAPDMPVDNYCCKVRGGITYTTIAGIPL